MDFADIKYSKTVEGNFDVQLIHNNTIIATITFPTEGLAAEYVDIKQKLKSHADVLIAEVTANLSKVAESTAKVASTEVKAVAETVAEDVAAKVNTFATNMKNKIEKAAHIDTSAKVGKESEPWQASVKASVGKDIVIDTSAKVVVP